MRFFWRFFWRIFWRIFWRARRGAGVMALVFGCAAAAAQEIAPLPPIRPPDLAAPAQDVVNLQPTPDDNDALREKALASHRIVGEGLAPIVGKNGCGIVAPLRVDAIVLAGDVKVALVPPVVMRAALASTLADWLRDDLAPALAGKGDRLAKIDGTGGYECRSRNSLAGTRLSEHATGNALDFEALVTERGKHFIIAASTSEANGDDRSFLAIVKKTACLRFATVLGPGADPYHAQHLHIDLAMRPHGAHLCQWNLPEGASVAVAKH
jgi:hypothetical protein